jgi:hypothetical protein
MFFFFFSRKDISSQHCFLWDKKQAIEWHIQYDTIHAKQTSHKRIFNILCGFKCMFMNL